MYNRTTNICFVIFGVIIAPSWFLFQFAPDLYLKHEWIKLLLMSLAIGIPSTGLFILVIPLIMGYVDNPKLDYEEKKKEGLKYHFTIFGLAASISALAFYVPNFVQYVKLEGDHRMSLKRATDYVVGLHCGLASFMIINRLILFPIIRRSW